VLPQLALELAQVQGPELAWARVREPAQQLVRELAWAQGLFLALILA